MGPILGSDPMGIPGPDPIVASASELESALWPRRPPELHLASLVNVIVLDTAGEVDERGACLAVVTGMEDWWDGGSI